MNFHSIMGLMCADRSLRRRFERMAEDAADYAKVVMTLAAMYDVKPSEAERRFEAYCRQSFQSWRDCGRILMCGGDVLPVVGPE